MGPDNRGYILNGKKSWVINAEKANYFIVIAKHEGMGQIVGLSRDSSAEYYKAAVSPHCYWSFFSYLILLLSSLQEKQQEGSMSAFIVSKKAPGVMVGDVVPFVGLKGLRVSEVIFEETAISLDCLLGSVGQGFDVSFLLDRQSYITDTLSRLLFLVDCYEVSCRREACSCGRCGSFTQEAHGYLV